MGNAIIEALKCRTFFSFFQMANYSDRFLKYLWKNEFYTSRS